MFGFLKGKMNVQLEKYQFSPGEEIVGKLSMNLKKPVEANGVNVRLLGREKITTRRGDQSSTDFVTIFDFEQPLDGSKTYPSGTELSYDFKIKIPEDVLSKSSAVSAEGTLGTIMKAASHMSDKSKRLDWYLIGRLDSKGFDLKKKIKINVA